MNSRDTGRVQLAGSRHSKRKWTAPVMPTLPPLPLPGPYQAAAGLPCMGFHLLPVFLGFLNDVFVGHACGRWKKTWVLAKDETQHSWDAGMRSKQRSPTQPVPATENSGSQEKTHLLWICLFCITGRKLPDSQASIPFLDPAAWLFPKPFFTGGSSRILLGSPKATVFGAHQGT